MSMLRHWLLNPLGLVPLVLAFCAVSALGQEDNAAQDDAAAKSGKKRILLIGQSNDGVHKPGTHEYAAAARVFAACLAGNEKVQVDVVTADGEWPEGPAKIRQSDCVVLYVAEGAKWIHQTPQRLEAFAAHAAKGGGLVVIHWGMGTREPQYIEGFLKLFGGCHGGPDRKYKVLDAELKVASKEHEIARGMKDHQFNAELYYRLKFVEAPTGLHSILKAPIDGRDETVAWAWERPDKGRSFGYSGGHFHKNWEREPPRRLVTQAILWAAKVPTPKEGVDVKVDKSVFELKKE